MIEQIERDLLYLNVEVFRECALILDTQLGVFPPNSHHDHKSRVEIEGF